LQAFLADESPQSFASVVDRLLASPQYGERWGRHWLDVARYADEDALGLSADPFANGWRYRDWVIRAFNEDMPYDLFVKAQIAGDLIEGESGNRLKPGVGLFGLGPWYYKIVEPPKAMADQMHDRIDVLTRGFLGLTVACARCHDHKYDPISTRDYYALAGVFFNTKYTEYPLADKQTVKAYHDVEERIGKLQEEIRQLLDAERKRVAEGLAGETARYLVAAREAVPAAPGALPAVEPVAARHGLDAETLERWVRYLQRADREHPYLNWWAERASASDEPELREAAAKFQTFVHDLIAEYKAIQEYNERVIEESKKSTDPYDIFCKGCRAETRSLARDKYILWRDLFDAPRKTEGDESSGGVLLLA
jgi:transposase-like protein